MQRVYNQWTSVYGPYINHEAKFEYKNLAQVLGSEHIQPHAHDQELINRLFRYAVDQQFQLDTEKLIGGLRHEITKVEQIAVAV